MPGYPDVDALLLAWLPTQVTATVFTADEQLPENLAYAMPLVQVITYGGTDDVVGVDESLVDIDVYAATLDAAKDLASAVRTAMRLRLAADRPSGVTVSKVRSVQRPAQRPYDSKAIRRVGQTWSITVHAPLS